MLSFVGGQGADGASSSHLRTKPAGVPVAPPQIRSSNEACTASPQYSSGGESLLPVADTSVEANAAAMTPPSTTAQARIPTLISSSPAQYNGLWPMWPRPRTRSAPIHEERVARRKLLQSKGVSGYGKTTVVAIIFPSTTTTEETVPLIFQVKMSVACLRQYPPMLRTRSCGACIGIPVFRQVAEACFVACPTSGADRGQVA